MLKLRPLTALHAFKRYVDLKDYVDEPSHCAIALTFPNYKIFRMDRYALRWQRLSKSRAGQVRRKRIFRDLYTGKNSGFTRCVHCKYLKSEGVKTRYPVHG